MLLDLHSHTWPRSHDSVLSPDDLVIRAKQSGLDGIVFTEHDTVWDAQSIKDLAEKHNFLVIGGVEISTDDGHMLCFGVEKYIFGMHRSDELAKHIAKVEGAMVAAHPYRRQMPWYVRNDDEYEQALTKAMRNPAYPYCIALEELNGRGSDKENAFAKRMCERMGLPGTAGTDSHAIQDIGKVATYFERDIEDVRGLITELNAGRFYAVDLRAGVAR